jgi:hypothetical protein
LGIHAIKRARKRIQKYARVPHERAQLQNTKESSIIRGQSLERAEGAEGIQSSQLPSPDFGRYQEYKESKLHEEAENRIPSCQRPDFEEE